jgi:hypothetical protein
MLAGFILEKNRYNNSEFLKRCKIQYNTGIGQDYGHNKYLILPQHYKINYFLLYSQFAGPDRVNR